MIHAGTPAHALLLIGAALMVAVPAIEEEIGWRGFLQAAMTVLIEVVIGWMRMRIDSVYPGGLVCGSPNASASFLPEAVVVEGVATVLPGRSGWQPSGRQCWELHWRRVAATR